MKFESIIYLIVVCMASVVTLGIMTFSCVQLGLGAKGSEFYVAMLNLVVGFWLGVATSVIKKFGVDDVVTQRLSTASSFPITLRTVNSE